MKGGGTPCLHFHEEHFIIIRCIQCIFSFIFLIRAGRMRRGGEHPACTIRLNCFLLLLHCSFILNKI